jgi:predicted O-methyltransferase YrrM
MTPSLAPGFGRKPMVPTAMAPVPTQICAPPGEWPAADDGFARLWEQARDIEGWLSQGQARILYRAATLVPAGQWIVEIGSHRGRSTTFLASGKSGDVAMLAVDPFDNPRWGGGPEALAAFRATLERFNHQDRVKVFRGISAEAVQAWGEGCTIGLLFVDGAHDRPSVLADIDGWEQRVASGGLVIFHDAFSSIGVTRALTERHLWNRHFRLLGSHRTLVVFQRVEPSAPADVASTLRFLGRYPYFLRNVAIKWSLRQGRQLPTQLLRYRAGDDLF